MIISVNAEETFDKIQLPFVIETLTKVSIEGTYLNIINAIYDKPTANIILNSEKLKVESLPAKIWNKTRMSTLTTSFQCSTGSPIRALRQEKEATIIQIWREGVKLSLDADDTILYTENPKPLELNY